MANLLKTSLRGKTHYERSQKFRSTVKRMTDNPYYPEPFKTDSLSTAGMGELADRYDMWIMRAEKKDIDAIATRNEVAEEVQRMMDKIGNYAELEGGGNMAALRSTGLELRRQRNKSGSSAPKKIPVLHMENLPAAGKVVAHTTSSRNPIEIYYTTGNPQNEEDWLRKGLFPPSKKVEMEGYASGLNHFFKFREIGEDGEGPWSNAVSTFVT